jgi:nucleoside 2-deoxyribosyltransferase
MGFIYLASPYSHPDPEVRHQRFEAVNRAAANLMRQGYVVFSPISHSHIIARDHDLPTDWEFWERIDIEFVKKCDRLFVLMIDGWDKSHGVRAERTLAHSLGIPVEFIRP